jgi:hypothetical protein
VYGVERTGELGETIRVVFERIVRRLSSQNGKMFSGYPLCPFVLHGGECHSAIQLIVNPDSKNARGAKRYSNVGFCLAKLRTLSTQSALSGHF